MIGRLHMFLLVSAAAGAGVLAGRTMHSGWRYPLAGLASYAVFLVLVRLWLKYVAGVTPAKRRRNRDWDPDVIDAPEALDFWPGHWFDVFDDWLLPVALVASVLALAFTGVYLIWSAPVILTEIAAECGPPCNGAGAGLGWFGLTVQRTWRAWASAVAVLCLVHWAR